MPEFTGVYRAHERVILARLERKLETMNDEHLHLKN